MNPHKKWLPVLKGIPKANHESLVAELEETYEEALASKGGLLHFVREVAPSLKQKYYKETYISPFTGKIVFSSDNH